MDHYLKGKIRGYESGLVILQAEGHRPNAGFSLQLPPDQAARRDFLRGFAQGLLDAANQD